MVEVLVSAILFLVLDQWSKKKAQMHARTLGFSWGPIVRIRCVSNARGIYRRDGNRWLFVLVWFAAMVAATILHRSGAWFQGPIAQFGLGLALGGAAGNLMDILRFRQIVDFIDLRWWPVFNLADVAIITGLAAALWRQGG